MSQESNFKDPAINTHGLEPYKGLTPFGENDEKIFFGRDREKEILIGKILSYDVTLLFAGTGVGKSSLLRAGVMPVLEKKYKLDVVYYADWVQKPIGGLREAIKDVLIGQKKKMSGRELKGLEELHPFLETCAVYSSRPLVLILDQFEELFLYHARSGSLTLFVDQLVWGINDKELPLKIVLAMREDFLAELNIFKGRIPDLFNNYYRLERLKEDQAREAIEGPARPEVGFDYSYGPGLVTKILHDLSELEQDIQHGISVVERSDKDLEQYVEAPYLQLVCQKLWEDTTKKEKKKIATLAQYRKLGEEEKNVAKKIVLDHVKGVMNELELRERVLAFEMFQHLVTPQGKKIAYQDKGLAYFVKVREEQTEQQIKKPILDPLVENRILQFEQRPSDFEQRPPDKENWYELYHDVLAGIIRQWMKQFQEDDDRRIYHQIVIAALKWSYEEEKDHDVLFGGDQLIRAKEWAEGHKDTLNSEEKEFLKESLTDERGYVAKYIRQWKWTAVVNAVFAVLAILFGIDAHTQRQEVARREAEKNWLLGVYARDWENDPLKASHYFMKVAAPDHGDSAAAPDNGGSAFSKIERLAREIAFMPFIAKVNKARDGAHWAFLKNAQLAGEILVGNAYLESILEYDNEIEKAAFSRDGHQIVILGVDGTIQARAILSSDDNQPLLSSPLTREALIDGIHFSQDGSRIITWSGSTARVWAEDGQALTSLLKHESIVTGAEFNRGAGRILTWSDDPAQTRTVRLWAVDKDQSPTYPLLDKDRINKAIFSQDGRRILAWGNDLARDPAFAFWVWATEDGQQLTSLKHKGKIMSAEFNQGAENLDRILTWSGDASLSQTVSQTVSLWEINSDSPSPTPLLDKDELNAVYFSQDGHRFLTWANGTGQVWAANDGQPLTPPLKHGDHIINAEFNRDADRILTQSVDNVGIRTVRLWAINKDRSLTAHLPYKDAVFSQDGRRILTWGNGTARVWAANDGQPLTPPLKHGDYISGAAFNQDADRILTWNKDVVRVWAIYSNQPLTLPHEGVISNVEFRENGRRILIWNDASVYMGAIDDKDQSPSPLLELTLSHKAKIDRIEIRQDGPPFLMWSGARVYMGEIDNKGQLLTTHLPLTLPPEANDAKISRVEFRDDGRRFLMWSGARVYMGEIDNKGQLLTSLLALPPEANDAKISRVEFRDDGRRILMWSGARVYMGKIDNNGQLLTSPLPLPPEANNAKIAGVKFSQDGRRILAWSNDSASEAAVWVWATEDGQNQPLTTLPKHKDKIVDVEFNRAADRILTRSGTESISTSNLTVRLWEIDNGQSSLLLDKDGIDKLRFSQDGRRFLTWSKKVAHVWAAEDGRALTPPLEHKNDIENATFNQNTDRILIWSKPAVHVWAIDKDQPSTVPLLHIDGSNEVVFSQDGRRILNWSKNTVWVWDLEDDSPLEMLNLLSLRLEVQSGTKLQSRSGDIETLSKKNWKEKKKKLCGKISNDEIPLAFMKQLSCPQK